MRRRSVLLSAVGSALTGALAAARPTAAAQDSAPADYRDHPIVGSWMISTPAGPAMAVFLADGSNIQGLPVTQTSPLGVTFVSTQVGRWEPTGPRSVHFTGVQLHTDAAGNLVGTITIDAFPEVDADGQTLHDDNPASGPTIRDAAGTVIAALKGGPVVTGVRMGVGAPGLTMGTPIAATPTS
jgi:hypothetical protein